jgi:hypothetical protein
MLSPVCAETIDIVAGFAEHLAIKNVFFGRCVQSFAPHSTYANLLVRQSLAIYNFLFMHRGRNVADLYLVYQE